MLFSAFAEGGQPPVNPSAPLPPPAATAQIDHLVPGQLKGSILTPPLTGPGPYQQVPSIDESIAVPLPPNKGTLAAFGKVDPVLTEACRLGDFVTLPLNRIIQQFTGDKGRAVLQVVPPLYRALLVDKRKLARPGVVYYFFDTAQPDCEVRVDGRTPIRPFPAGRTTALAPANPRAVAQELAMIRSWPKR